MKKTIIILLTVFILASCGEPVVYNETYLKKLELEEKIRSERLEKERAYELEKARIEASKPAEVIRQEQNSSATDSLKYMENSQKAHDVLQGAAVGYGIFRILTD